MLATAALAGIAPAANAITGEACVTAAEATYQHQFDGPGGTVTITAGKPLCEGQEQAFSLVSYTASATTFAVPQFVYDTDSAWIGSDRRSVTLDVDVPGCFTQVDTIFGTGIVNEISDSYVYGDVKLGSPSGIGSRSTGGQAWYNGGDTVCAPQPSVTFHSYCDGVLHTRLANAAYANVDASFVVDGKRIQVRPGKSADLTSRPSGTVEVRDNSFTRSSGAWTAPADCAPPAPPVTTPSPVPSSATPSSPAPASSAPSSVAPSSAVPSWSEPDTAWPVPVADDDSGLPVTGTSSGVLAFYALGFLLVGVGLLIIARQARRSRHSA